ncbi:hypothetical protein, partial [Enterococcus faecalis]
TATGEIGAGTFNGKITWEGKTVDLTGISQTETDAAKVTAIKEKVADALGLDAAQVTYTAGSATAAGTLAVSSAAGDFANKNTAFT